MGKTVSCCHAFNSVGEILRGNELEKRVRPIRSVIAPKAPKYIRKLTFYPLLRGKNYIKEIFDREPDITPHGLSRIWSPPEGAKQEIHR